MTDSETIYGKAVDGIRAVLRAFQVNVGEDIRAKGEDKCRAIYTVDVQVSEDRSECSILGFSFGAQSDVDYNQAFSCLFFNEASADVTQI